MLFAIVLVLAVSSIYSVYAQSDVGNMMDKKDLTSKVLDLDDILTPTITATLTGLSLTGASFLVTMVRSTNEDSGSTHVHLARKSFIKAFFMFLLCTIALFVFDFIEILDEIYIVLSTSLDVVITYALFGIGVMYLANAARHLYITYGK